MTTLPEHKDLLETSLDNAHFYRVAEEAKEKRAYEAYVDYRCGSLRDADLLPIE